MNSSRPLCLILLCLLLCMGFSCFAGDWPMFRADAHRTGYSPDSLPDALELRWVHHAHAPQPAWPSSERMSYDFAHQPILAEGKVVLGSTSDFSVVALDAEDGTEVWRFISGGPVRFAPAAWRGRVFVSSDDGHVYALSIADGALLWKHRGGPDARLVIGNERMISRWPGRGGPVVFEDAVYYAAGIWPSDGVFLYALNAVDGSVLWCNDAAGSIQMGQPHGGAEALSGVAPQGYLAATENMLIVPTGRAVPAGFDRQTGELVHYLLQENGSMGGSRALVADGFVINGGCFLEEATGKLAARAGRGVLGVLPDGVLQFTGSTLLAYSWDDADTHARKGEAVQYRCLQQRLEVPIAAPTESVRRAAKTANLLPALQTLFRTDIVFKYEDESVARQTSLERNLAQSRPDIVRAGGEILPFQAAAYERTCEVIGAGNEAICATGGLVNIVDLGTGRACWSTTVDGAAVGLAAANGALIVSTTTGAVYCFGGAGEAHPAAAEGKRSMEPPVWAVQAAEAVLRESGVRAGYALDLGCGTGDLALALAQHSDLYIVGIESDPRLVARARRRLHAVGIYGTRVTVLEGQLDTSRFPAYFADLVVSSAQLQNASFAIDAASVDAVLRPHGGVACLGASGALRVRRRGPLEGEGSWTHQNANAANTLCSDDTVARGPLEAAWYRDGAIELVDRHAQGPAPLYSTGVMVVEGVDGLCGMDAYNGRTRWVHEIKGILADWNGVHHDVGVGDTGSNFCLSEDAVFVRVGPECIKLDLYTGEKLNEFTAPGTTEAHPNWGYIAYADGILYGTVPNQAHSVSPRYSGTGLRTESVLFFALDATTGEVRWTYRPRHSLRNNAIAVAGGRVFLIDRPLAPEDRIDSPELNGKHRPVLAPEDHPGGTLMAIDSESGAVLWENNDSIWGTQLALSVERGKLLMYFQAVRHKFFRLPSEIGGRIAAFDLESGRRIWDREATYTTRPMINGGILYAEGGAWDLSSGESIPWELPRSYGCGQVASSSHLMMYRSATLGYLDLTRDAGVENFGGIRPSCWISAIPAGGRVLVQDGSSKCACSYQMQAWLALQPRPTVGDN